MRNGDAFEGLQRIIIILKDDNSELRSQGCGVVSIRSQGRRRGGRVSRGVGVADYIHPLLPAMSFPAS